MTLALTALAACHANAADNVTVYGGVDGNITRVSAQGRGSIWQVRDGGMYVSKIGFTGSEDLGGGSRPTSSSSRNRAATPARVWPPTATTSSAALPQGRRASPGTARPR